MRETVSRSRLRVAIGSKTCRVCALLCPLWALIGCSAQSSTSGPVLRRMLSAGRLPPCPFGPGRTTPVRTTGAKAGRDSPERGRPWKCRSPPFCSELQRAQAGPALQRTSARVRPGPTDSPQQAPNTSSKNPRKMANTNFQTALFCVCAVRGPIGSDDGQSVASSASHGPPSPSISTTECPWPATYRGPGTAVKGVTA